MPAARTHETGVPGCVTIAAPESDRHRGEPGRRTSGSDIRLLASRRTRLMPSVSPRTVFIWAFAVAALRNRSLHYQRGRELGETVAGRRHGRSSDPLVERGAFWVSTAYSFMENQARPSQDWRARDAASGCACQRARGSSMVQQRRGPRRNSFACQWRRLVRSLLSYRRRSGNDVSDAHGWPVGRLRTNASTRRMPAGSLHGCSRSWAENGRGTVAPVRHHSSS